MPEYDEDRLIEVVGSLAGIVTREEAVSHLLELLRAEEIAESRAVVDGFAQRIRLYDGTRLLKKPVWIEAYAANARTDPRKLEIEILTAAILLPSAPPIVRSHLGDLVFSFRSNRADVGERAFDAYLELAADPAIENYDRHVLLAHAGRLASHLSDDSRLEIVRRLLGEHLDETLALSNAEPGTFLRSLDVFLRFNGDAEFAQERLATAADVYTDSLIREEIVEHRAHLCGDASVAEALRREHLDRVIDDAINTRETLAREHILREAQAFARRHGFRDAVGAISSSIRAIKPEDYELKIAELAHTFDEEALAKRQALRMNLETALPADAWRTWAGLFPHLPPDSERPPYELTVADRIATLTVINPQGHVAFVPSNDDEIRRYRQREQDQLLYYYNAQLLIGPGLAELLDRPECVTAWHEAVGAAAALVDSRPARRRVDGALAGIMMADASAVSDAVPVLEAMIRELAVALDVSIYNPSGAANEFKTMGGLIRDLQAHLGALARHWDFALTDTLGYNIRNDYLHGFIDDLDDFQAVVVLQVFAQLLFLVPMQRDIPSDGTRPGGVEFNAPDDDAEKYRYSVGFL